MSNASKTSRKRKEHLKPHDNTDRYPLIYILGIVVAAVFAFSPGLTNGFVNWDDYAYIVNNPLVTEFSVANLIKMFTPTTFVVGNYHPLTVLIYGVQHAVFGLNPAGYHAVNIAIHLVSTVLASMIAWRLFQHRVATIAMTAVFALHPLRVESVVWAAELKDVLYVSFFLAATYLYIVNIQRGKTTVRDNLAVYVLFFLSLLSKGQAVAFPVIMLVLDYILQRPWSKTLVIEKTLFFITSIGFGLLAITAQRGGQLNVTGPQLVLPFTERLACALYGMLMYFIKFFVPTDLACFYDYPLPNEMSGVFLYASISAAILISALIATRKHRMLLGGLLWFLIVIGPVSQIMPVGNALYADRYSYLSMVGIALALAYAVKVLTNRFGQSVMVGSSIAIAVVLTIAAHTQAKTWDNNITLWSAALEANPQSALVLNNLAGDYLDSNKLDVAIPLFERAVANPGRYKEIYRTLNNLGLAVSRAGNRDSSLYWFKRSIETDSAFADPYFNRGGVLQFMNRHVEACQDFSRFIKVTGGDARGYLMRAKSLRSMDSISAAIRDYRQAVAVNPAYIDAYLGLANIYFTQKQYQPALDVYSTAIAEVENNGELLLNRAKVRYVMADYRAALQDYDAAEIRGTREPALRQAIQQGISSMPQAAASSMQIRR